ncbi:MAG: cell division protein FtsZ [Fimbriimonadaceae bacterium]|nr:cell division protein FtsZ [Fimbriimonadaceae bacterium]
MRLWAELLRPNLSVEPVSACLGPMNPVNLFETRAVLRVFGIGGGGGNAVSRLAENGREGVDLVVLNTDRQALGATNANSRLIIGEYTTRGLGVGGDPTIGERSAIESERAIKSLLDGADMVFITAGMGGGTGTGATPVVAKLARQMDILTIAIVTTPFEFEGPKRKRLALEGLEKLRQQVDTLIVIPNQRLLDVADKKVSLKDAFLLADSVLQQGVQGISDIILETGMVNVDFADVRAVMKDAGVAMLGLGQANGEGRARRAAEMAVHSPMMDHNMAGAKRILVNIAAGPDLSMGEVQDVMEYIQQIADAEDAAIYMGQTVDNSLGDSVKVTLVAAGFDPNAERPRDSRVYADEKPHAAPELRTIQPVLADVPEVEPDIPSPIAEIDLDIPSFIRRRTAKLQ